MLRRRRVGSRALNSSVAAGWNQRARESSRSRAPGLSIAAGWNRSARESSGGSFSRCPEPMACVGSAAAVNCSSFVVRADWLCRDRSRRLNRFRRCSSPNCWFCSLVVGPWWPADRQPHRGLALRCRIGVPNPNSCKPSSNPVGIAADEIYAKIDKVGNVGQTKPSRFPRTRGSVVPRFHQDTQWRVRRGGYHRADKRQPLQRHEQRQSVRRDQIVRSVAVFVLKYRRASSRA